jgi:hypothetical protein
MWVLLIFPGAIGIVEGQIRVISVVRCKIYAAVMLVAAAVREYGSFRLFSVRLYGNWYSESSLYGTLHGTIL